MKSIRIFLTISLISIITLINFVSALHGYRTSMEEAEGLFDSKLSDTVKLLASVSSDDFISSPIKISTENTALQVWKDEKTLLYRSANTPATPIGKFKNGFGQKNFNQYRWKTIAYFDDINNRWFFLAERTDIHYTLAENIVLNSILPTILALPVLALLIWFVTGYGLTALGRLANELSTKEADDLSSININNQPKELIQVIDSTNTLLARLEAAFEREKQFSSDAAHEIKTPLSILKVHLYNLSEQFPGNESVDQLKAGFDQLGHLLEQILTLYRSSPDQFSANFEQVNLNSLVQDVIADEFTLIDKRDQEIILEGDDAPMLGDTFALKTLLHNLLSNANKYTPVGGKIRMATYNTSEGVCLEIEDSGPGISDHLFDRVFDRFYRVDGDRHDSDADGCGLGLAIVKHIAELHHATITLSRSEKLHGLKILIFFPNNPTTPFNVSSYSKQDAHNDES